MTLRVLLAGQEAAGAHILRSVVGSGHEPVAVLTQDPDVTGGPSSLRAQAEGAGVPVLPARLVRDPDFATYVREHAVDVLLNVHSLHIIAPEVLDAPAIGSFNLHPGPLPEYAGLNTVGWAIFDGAREYGVTVHWMEPQIDGGPIALDERFEVDERATALSLSARCTRVGVALLDEVLRRAAYDPGSIPRKEQDPTRRRYYARGSIPQGGRVDWTRRAAEVCRFGRAFEYGPFASPWGRPFTDTDGGRLELTGLTPTGVACDEPPGTPWLSRDDTVWMACADEWVEVRRLHVAGLPVEPSTVIAGSLVERGPSQR